MILDLGSRDDSARRVDDRAGNLAGLCVQSGAGEKCGKERQQCELQEETWLQKMVITVTVLLRACEGVKSGRVEGSTLP